MKGEFVGTVCLCLVRAEAEVTSTLFCLVISFKRGRVELLYNLVQFYNVWYTFAVKCAVFLIRPISDSYPLELLSGPAAKIAICVRWQTNSDINEVIALVRKSIVTRNSQYRRVGLNGDLVPM